MKQILIISDRNLPFFALLTFPGVSSSVCAAEELDDSVCGKNTLLLLDMAGLDKDSSEYCCEIARTTETFVCAFADAGWKGSDSLLPLGIACFIWTEDLDSFSY